MNAPLPPRLIVLASQRPAPPGQLPQSIWWPPLPGGPLALATGGPDDAAAQSPMLPSVRAGFPSFTAQFEGRVAFMYLDVKGYVTCGVGNLIDPMSLAMSLPWLLPDGSPATQDQIAAEYTRVKGMPKGLVASHYQSPTGLHLDDAGIDALVLAHLDADAQVLAQTFPDFPSFPAEAQKAILSMSWAMGSHFPARWPLFSASVRAQDWAACATNCSISTVGNAGVAPRNAANAALFLQAANGDGGSSASAPANASSADVETPVAPATVPASIAVDDLSADDGAPASAPADDASADVAGDGPAPVSAGADSGGAGAAAAVLVALAAGWIWRREIVEAIQRIAAQRFAPSAAERLL